MSSGVLSITAAKADPSIRPYINNYEYTSGVINSYYSFSQTYGYFEMSAQLPKGQGFWPAFWLLPTSGAWPPEIDIMEVLGHDTTTIIPAMHSMATGTRVATGGPYKVADLSVGMHTFGLNWQADYITWYVDGVEIMKAPTPADLHSPMYMIANLAVGGHWPGPVNSTTPFPSSFKIDYIRVYQDAGTAPPSPPPPGGGTGVVLTADDTAGQSLTGGSGNDTIYAGHNSAVMTGGGGADSFVFQYLPWNAGRVTDFTARSDIADLRPLFEAAGYTGTNPITDGYLKFELDGSGGTKILFDPDGPGTANPWSYLITTLNGVSPANLTMGVDWLFQNASAPPPSPPPPRLHHRHRHHLLRRRRRLHHRRHRHHRRRRPRNRRRSTVRQRVTRSAVPPPTIPSTVSAEGTGFTARPAWTRSTAAAETTISMAG